MAVNGKRGMSGFAGAMLSLAWGVGMEAGAYIPDPVFPVEGFEAIPGDRQAHLQWMIPSHYGSEYTTVVVRAESKNEIYAGRGTVVYRGIGEEVLDVGLTNGTPYIYAAFLYHYFLQPGYPSFLGPPTIRSTSSKGVFVSVVPQAPAPEPIEIDGGTTKVGGTNCFVISWPPIPGRACTVQRANELGPAGGFSTLATLPYPVGSYTDMLHEASGPAFYRVETGQQP